MSFWSRSLTFFGWSGLRLGRPPRSGPLSSSSALPLAPLAEPLAFFAACCQLMDSPEAHVARWGGRRLALPERLLAWLWLAHRGVEMIV